MSEQDNSRAEAALRLAAERAAADPYYLAHALDAYQRVHGISDARIIEELGCTPRDLYLIALCRMPDTASMSRFNDEIRAIAERFQIAPAPLASLVRKARRATEAELEGSTAGTNFFTRPVYGMAAQDRETDEGTAESDDSEKES